MPNQEELFAFFARVLRHQVARPVHTGGHGHPLGCEPQRVKFLPKYGAYFAHARQVERAAVDVNCLLQQLFGVGQTLLHRGYQLALGSRKLLRLGSVVAEKSGGE